ncbi:MAG: dienelactone hydrolase family protein [Vicinamibacterales bacterium]
MSDHTHDDARTLSEDGLTRRSFVSLSVAASVAAAAGTAGAQGLKVAEREVTITTADGACDAFFAHPASGRHPGVIIWADAFGLRPAVKDMARRLAARGYAVLAPNPFYRVTKAPGIDSTNFSFGNQADRAKLGTLMGSVTAAGAAEKDADAFVAFLDKQAAVDPKKKMGVQGYCMGGPLTVRTAAHLPARIGAGASFHGGGLVTNQPSSPHLLATKIKARMYFGIAANDDAQQPEAKTVLKDTFAAARVPAEIEVYASAHGWCMVDMPAEKDKPIYNKADAEKAWAKLEALYKAALV